MAKKGILYGTGIVKGLLRGSMWAGVLLFLLFISPLYAETKTCTAIDYNITTIAAGWGHIVGLTEDGTVLAVGDNTYGQLDVSGWKNNIKQPVCLDHVQPSTFLENR